MVQYIESDVQVTLRPTAALLKTSEEHTRSLTAFVKTMVFNQLPTYSRKARRGSCFSFYLKVFSSLCFWKSSYLSQ